jgi:methionyl-tRNA formyltransferase
MKDIKILIITQELTRVVLPISNNYKVVGIVNCIESNFYFKNLLRFCFNLFQGFLNLILKNKQTSLYLFCLFRRINYFNWNKDNKSELISFIKKTKPDLILVFSSSRLLSKDVYELPRFGTINLHPSILPKYRGPFPEFWHYYNMDLEAGVTVHFIDSGVDTGDILLQESVLLPLGLKSKQRDDILIGFIGVNVLMKVITLILNNSVVRISQKSDINYEYSRRIKISEHLEIIKWDEWSIEKIWNLLRGTEGWLKCLPEMNGIWKGQFWIIGDYVKFENLDFDYRKIKKNIDGSYFIELKDGIIILNKKWSWINFIKYVIGI